MLMNDLVTGIGEVLWDLLPDGRKIGGAPANFAYHISQFGLPGCVVSAVGHDSLGDEIVATVDSKDILNRIERTDFPTGTVKVEVDAAGIPRYDICSDVAWDHIPFTPKIEETAMRTRAFSLRYHAHPGE
ncbi:MAG: carbohydrate kinase, partial [Paramuribaculum sp.]|nr:carbohydrate kinase [Paramuribaculum sp.]